MSATGADESVEFVETVWAGIGLAGIDVEIPPDRMLVVGVHGTEGSSVASAVLCESDGGGRRIVILRPLGRTQDPMFEDRFGEESPDNAPERPTAGASLPAGLSPRAIRGR